MDPNTDTLSEKYDYILNFFSAVAADNLDAANLL